jgi:hypothetical protein
MGSRSCHLCFARASDFRRQLSSLHHSPELKKKVTIMSIVRQRRLSWSAVLLTGLLLLTGQTPHTQGAPPVTVRDGHPRIWLTPPVLTRLRAQAAANSPRWQALKSAVDRSATPDWDIGVIDYALAYQVTGNTWYADQAIALMQLWVNGGLGTITGDSGYQTRVVLPAMAVGYDWCYDRLTPAQRARFRTQMEQWADWVWPETNPARAHAWAVDAPGNNYYHGFMMTWLIGLALAGDSAKAGGYIDLARQKWLTAVEPYLNTTGAGGYLLEGTNYGTGSTRAIFWYLSAHASATGEDLVNAPGFTWARDAILSKLYQTTPERDRVYPGGDQARDSTAPLSDYDRGSMLVSLSSLDPTTVGYAKWWLDNTRPNQDQWRFTQWEEFLWYLDDVTAVDYTQALRPGYWSQGAGWMTSRSGWDTDATQVTMMVGPTYESHQDRAQNGFMIFRHDWLAACAKLTSQSGLVQEASANNVITIGGHEQTNWQNEAKVLHFDDKDPYAYFAGEAAAAYNSPDQRLLNGFRRELLFLKPNRVLVFDHVNAVDPGMVKKWHLNTLNEPTVEGLSYRTTVADSTLFGRTLFPAASRISKQPLSNGRDGAQSSWRIDVAAPTGQSENNFLNVLEVAPAAQTAMPPALPVTTSRPSLIGAQIGNQLVLFDTAPSWTIMYQLNSTPAGEHYILDQAPGKWYRVTVQSGRGIPLQELRVQASDQGVLTFPVTAVTGRTVMINPDATIAKAKRKSPATHVARAHSSTSHVAAAHPAATHVAAARPKKHTGGTRISRKGGSEE